jgi:hypothetical protein
MAEIKATFQTDFSNFYDAVQQAVVELKSFESESAKVEDQLTRMGNRFSGQRVIQEASLMAEAIERAGGTATLTDKELERVGRTAAEAAEKMRALGMEVPANLQQLADAAADAGQKTSGLSVSVLDMVKAYVSAEAIIGLVKGAFSALTGVISASIKSASDAEQADRELMAALEAQGTAMPSVVNAYRGYASELQRTTIYSDDAVAASQRMLAQIGGVMPKEMEKATLAAANLAAATGKDLPEATRMLADAANGSTERLEKLGITMKDSEGNALDFATQIDNVNSKFGGAAVAAADTYAGSIAQLENAWDNVQESVGRAIVQNESVQTLISEVTKAVGLNTGELNENATVNNLVSESAIMLAKAASLAAEGIQFMGTAGLAARQAVDAFAMGLGQMYTWLQKIELQTQKAVNWATGSEASAARIREAGENLKWAADQHEELAADMKAATESNRAWVAGIDSLQAGLAGIVTKMEETKGQTRAVTATQTEAAAAWNASTGALNAHLIAADQVAKGVAGMKIGFGDLSNEVSNWGLTTKVASLGAFQTLQGASNAAMSDVVTGANGAAAAVFQITTEAQGATQALKALSAVQSGAQLALPQGGSGESYAPWAYGQNVNPLIAMELSKKFGTGVTGATFNAFTGGLAPGQTVNVQSGAVQMQFPIMNDPQAMDQIATVVGDAIMKKLTRTGALA